MKSIVMIQLTMISYATLMVDEEAPVLNGAAAGYRPNTTAPASS